MVSGVIVGHIPRSTFRPSQWNALKGPISENFTCVHCVHQSTESHVQNSWPSQVIYRICITVQVVLFLAALAIFYNLRFKAMNDRPGMVYGESSGKRCLYHRGGTDKNVWFFRCFFFFLKPFFSPYRLSTVFACFKAYLFIKGQPGGCCSKGLLNALLEALYIILLALFHDLQIVTSDEVDVGGDALS